MLKDVIKNNRLIITNFQDIGLNTFYVDTEKELDGSYEFVFWDFKIPKWVVRFTTCLNKKFIVINNHAEKIARYFEFAYPNFYIEYEDYYVISVAIYARRYKFVFDEEYFDLAHENFKKSDEWKMFVKPFIKNLGKK